jgi:hypothetical protein
MRGITLLPTWAIVGMAVEKHPSRNVDERAVMASATLKKIKGSEDVGMQDSRTIGQIFGSGGVGVGSTIQYCGSFVEG